MPPRLLPFPPLCWLLPFLFLGACSSSTYLPSAQDLVRSHWQSFDEAKSAFDQIEIQKSTETDLNNLGFSPTGTPNTQLLNYLDIFQRFIPNQSVRLTDLDPAVQSCLASHDHCHGYEFAVHKTNSERYGNVLLDLLYFHRKTNFSGWDFKALVVLQDELVVYKLWSGKPNLDQHQERKNPLGILQSPENFLPPVVAP